MTRLLVLLLLMGLLIPDLAATTVANAQEPLDLPVQRGRFYTQANGQEGSRLGFPVVDDDRAPFWREFQRLGGPSVVGYPTSRRFVYAGFETQVFQKLVFQWKPGDNRLDFLNVFDLLSDNGKDAWLLTNKQVPNKGKFDENGKPFDEITRNRLALLDKNPAIKSAYLGVKGDPVAMNGLPTAEITDYSNVQVLRAQRVVYQYWKEAVPWAAARTVTVANGGDVAKEAGLFPDAAIKPMSLVDATAPDSGRVPDSGAPVASSPAPSSPSAPAPAAPSAPSAGSPGLPFALKEGEALKVLASPSTGAPKPGVLMQVTVRVTDVSNRPVPGALVLVLVHYPLKDDNTIYAVDGVFFSRELTDASGSLTMNIAIDPKVPAGVPVNIEVSALYPPTAGRTEINVAVG